MKVAKTKSDIAKILLKLKDLDPKSLKKEMSYYVEIDDPSSQIDLEKNKFGVWAQFENLEKYYKNRPAQIRYEIFVAGFIYFFEKHVKEAGDVERTLYFDWGKINKKVNLTIFLKPLYNQPLKTETPDITSDVSSNGNGNGNSNGSDNKQKDFDSKMLKTAIASPPAETPTDPPPPPQPPPPPKE